MFRYERKVSSNLHESFLIVLDTKQLFVEVSRLNLNLLFEIHDYDNVVQLHEVYSPRRITFQTFQRFYFICNSARRVLSKS
jgi:hypothetical protein